MSISDFTVIIRLGVFTHSFIFASLPFAKIIFEAGFKHVYDLLPCQVPLLCFHLDDFFIFPHTIVIFINRCFLRYRVYDDAITVHCGRFFKISTFSLIFYKIQYFGIKSCIPVNAFKRFPNILLFLVLDLGASYETEARYPS